MGKNFPIDVRSVANYVLAERQRFGLSTTHLELQKLIYFAHVNALVRLGEPLVDGYFEAWEHGPVHTYVWQEMKHHKRSPIVEQIQSTDLITGITEIVNEPSDPEIRALISEVVLQTRGLTAAQLRNRSHIERGPWAKIWERRKVNLASSARIPDNEIQSFYRHHMWTVVPVDSGAADDEDHPPEPYRGRK